MLAVWQPVKGRPRADSSIALTENPLMRWQRAVGQQYGSEIWQEGRFADLWWRDAFRTGEPLDESHAGELSQNGL